MIGVLASPAKGWVVPFVLFTIHNLEEVLFDLPAWGREHFAWLRGMDVSRGQFGAAVVAVTAALIFIAIALRQRHDATVMSQRVFLIVMALVFCWHIAVSLWAGSPQPGVATSVLFLPLFVALERRLSRSSA